MAGIAQQQGWTGSSDAFPGLLLSFSISGYIRWKSNTQDLAEGCVLLPQNRLTFHSVLPPKVLSVSPAQLCSSLSNFGAVGSAQ